MDRSSPLELNSLSHDLDQQQSTKADTSNVENSLVFGDSKEKDDTSLFELQNRPDETPFLDKLKDPFDDTTNEVSPVRKGYSELRQDGWMAPFDIDTQREDKTDDTQRIQETNDTQRIQEANDTQRIKNDDPNDTQIYQDTQKIENDTQVINTTQTVPLHNLMGQKNVSDTQKIYNDIDALSQDTQKVNLDTQIIRASPDTQIVTSFLDTQVIRSSSQDKVPESPPVHDFSHRLMSHRQVLNTQDENDASFSLEKSLGDLEEVRTDDEKESEKDVDVSDLQYEDSLLTTKLSKKRRKIYDPSPYKLTKLEKPVFASPIEIGESSPVVKKSDLLRLPDDLASSPQKTYESSENEETKSEKHITAKRKNKYIIETQSQPDILTKEHLETLTEDNIHHKNSVWAIFNLKMYPGTITEQGQDQMAIQFSDGLVDIKNSDLFVLDIRVGDTIRIRSSTIKYVVVGLGHSDSNSIHCMRGYNLVYVKKQTAKGANSADICVPLAECFMELEDWIQHQQAFGLIYNQHDILKHDKKNNISEMLSVLATPMDGLLSSPASNRTSPRKLLQHDNTGKAFSRKLFCITSIEGERKDKIKQLIESNGGVLVEGLSELFEYSTSTNDHLMLKSHLLGEFTFGAIISNNHCRSAKYLQALALGWPIVSDIYIEHCVSDRSRVEHWPSYLLPAGHSTRINSLRSLDVYQFRRNYDSDRTMNEQASNNGHLLEKYDIVVLSNKRNDHTLETCRFIFYSFGAKSLTYCSNYNEIANSLKLKKNVLVYDDGDIVRKKLVALRQKPNSRTRSQGKVAQQLYATSNNLVNIGVIDWEYIVQCVISGYIWDTKTYDIESNAF